MTIYSLEPKIQNELLTKFVNMFQSSIQCPVLQSNNMLMSQVLDDSRKWWKARNRRGVTAHVPHTIVAPALSPPSSPHLYPNPIYTHYQVR